LEFDSNITVERFQHPRKQSSQRTSTQDGTWIDVSDAEPEKRSLVIRTTFESGANVTAERASELGKEAVPIASDGRGIDSSDGQPLNAEWEMSDSFEPGSNVSAESEKQSQKQ
jgi:hypothetical protein